MSEFNSIHLSDILRILIDVLCFTRVDRQSMFNTWVHTERERVTFSHTLKLTGREEVGGRFITPTPEDVTAHITQWQPTGAEDGRNMESCQERKRRKTHRDQKCVSVSIATHRQPQQPGAPGVIKQREKGAGRGWWHWYSLQKEKKKVREKSLNVSKNSANINLIELWVRAVEWHKGFFQRTYYCLLSSLLFCSSQEGAAFFLNVSTSKLWIWDILQLRFPQHITCICIMLLSVKDNGCSGRRRGNPGTVRQSE